MPKQKIDDRLLIQGHRNGLNATQIAQNLGVSPQAVRKRLKVLNLSIAKDVATYSAAEIVTKDLNLAEQCRRLMEGTFENLELLEAVAKGDRPEKDAEKLLSNRTSVLEGLHKCRQEGRHQINLMYSILKDLHDMREVKMVQDAILTEIKKTDPETGRRIADRLAKLGATISLLKLDGGK